MLAMRFQARYLEKLANGKGNEALELIAMGGCKVSVIGCLLRRNHTDICQTQQC